MEDDDYDGWFSGGGRGVLQSYGLMITPNYLGRPIKTYIRTLSALNSASCRWRK